LGFVTDLLSQPLPALIEARRYWLIPTPVPLWAWLVRRQRER